MLSKHPGKCRFPHGHTRKIEFILESASLDSNGMVCDFKIIKDAVGSYLETLDHALCMNSEDPMFATLQQAYGDSVVAFDKTEPTTEVLAEKIHSTASRLLAEYAERNSPSYPLSEGVRLVRVRVWETSSSWAEYEDRG